MKFDEKIQHKFDSSAFFSGIKEISVIPEQKQINQNIDTLEVNIIVWSSKILIDTLVIWQEKSKPQCFQAKKGDSYE